MHDPGYCWLPEYVYPYESLRSLLSKFILLNHISVSDVQNEFSSPCTGRFKRSSPLRNNKKLISLEVFNRCLSPDLLINGIGVNPDQVKYSTIEPYAIADYCKDFFRYCPTCLSVGFHSPFHQLNIFQRCPIHGDKLLVSCVSCGQLLFFVLTAQDQPYGCSNCGHKFNNNDRACEDGLADQIREFVHPFLSIGLKIQNCFEKRIADQDWPSPEKSIFNINLRMYSEKCYQRDLQLTPTRWASVFGVPSGWASKSFSGFPIKSSSSVTLNAKQQSDPNVEFRISGRYSFKAIYKSIKRHFRKHLLAINDYPIWSRDNRVKILARYLDRTSCYPRPVQTIRNLSSLRSSAYFQYSLHLDHLLSDSNSLSELIGNHWDGLQTDLDMMLERQDIAAPIKVKLVERILADDCFSFMVECLMRCLVQRKHGQYIFEVLYRDRRYDSHWLINANSPESVKLHFWSIRPDIHKVVKYIKSHGF